MEVQSYEGNVMICKAFYPDKENEVVQCCSDCARATDSINYLNLKSEDNNMNHGIYSDNSLG